MSGKGSPRCRWRCPGGTSRQTRPQRGPLPKLPNPPAAAVAAPAAAGSHPWELLAFLGREGQAGVHTREYTTITTHTHSGGGGYCKKSAARLQFLGGSSASGPAMPNAGPPAPRSGGLRCSVLYRRGALQERAGLLRVSLLHPRPQRLPRQYQKGKKKKPPSAQSGRSALLAAAQTLRAPQPFARAATR